MNLDKFAPLFYTLEGDIIGVEKIKYDVTFKFLIIPKYEELEMIITNNYFLRRFLKHVVQNDLINGVIKDTQFGRHIERAYNKNNDDTPYERIYVYLPIFLLDEILEDESLLGYYNNLRTNFLDFKLNLLSFLKNTEKILLIENYELDRIVIDYILGINKNQRDILVVNNNNNKEEYSIEDILKITNNYI